MAKARLSADWDRTALLAALQTIDGKITDFHPFADDQEPSPPRRDSEVAERIEYE
jgi:hypothetical protein